MTADDLGRFRVRDRGDARELRRTANLPVVRSLLGEAFEQPLGDLAVPVRRKRPERLVGVPRQGLRHTADRLQVAQIDGTAIRIVALPVVPGAHQCVLQDRQLVHVVADVVEQALHQARRDAPAADADGAGDRRLQLVAGQARDQVLAIADRLGQSAKPVAVAEEVRAHGDDDVHRHFGLLRRLEQQLDEGRRFIPGVALFGEIGKAEKLFELIDEDQQILMRLQPG